MPVSKNKRKSKRAQSRKVNRRKAEGSSGGGGTPPWFDHPSPLSPQGAIPELMPDENRRYQVNSPDEQALYEMEQTDAITLRSVTFEMSEAHHSNIGLREIDLDGEMGGGDIAAPMVATIKVDPLSTIEGHPKWQTGQELIDFLDSDPNVFRGEFNGNRWQGSGARWDECPPNVLDCSYRVVVKLSGTPPECAQCETELRPEEVHFHILYENSIFTICEGCWSKDPLPEEDRTLGANVSA